MKKKKVVIFLSGSGRNIRKINDSCRSLNLLHRHPVKKTQSVHISVHIANCVSLCVDES